MADYYNQWSICLENCTQEQVQFIIRRLQAVKFLEDVLEDQDDYKLDAEQKSILEECQNEPWVNLVRDRYCSTPIVVKEAAEDSQLQHLYLYDEEGAVDLEIMGEILAAWTAKFPERSQVCIHWSSGCTRMIPDAFGGGVVLVYKGKAHYMDTGTWAAEKLKELEEQENNVQS